MVAFFLLVELCILFNTSIAAYYAYVTSLGLSNSVCSKLAPCGHFQHALNIVTDEEIIISITGMNSVYQSSYCQVIISGSVTLIFDTTTISSTTDWFGSFTSCDYWCTDVLGVWGLDRCDYPFEIASNANVKFYGLIWDQSITYQTYSGTREYNPAIGSWIGSSIYCEDCILRSGSIETRSNSADFHNCLFDDFVINWFGGEPTFRQSQYGDTYYQNDFILQHDLELNIINSTISNIADTQFVRIADDLQYKSTVYVSNSTVLSSTTFIYVANSWSLSFVTNKIHIESSTFIDSDSNGLIVLYVEPSTLIDITMNNINISYTQYIEQDSPNAQDKEVIHIGSENANIDITNSVITALLHCGEDCLVTSTGRRRRLAISCNEAPSPWCNTPNPFLVNHGVATLFNVWIKSDSNGSAWKQYYFDTMWQYQSAGMYYLPTEQHDFSLSDKASDNEPYFAAILNAGVMDINELNVINGAHASILYNHNGVMNIDGIYTHYDSKNASSYYDRWSLMFHTCITNNFGTLTISNGALSGADKSLINIYAGDISLNNVMLSQSMFAVMTLYSAGIIALNDVSVFEVGTYYTRFGAAIYYSGSLGEYIEYGSFFEALATMAPLHLSGNDILIRNCLFYYIAPYGVININQIGVFSSNNDNTSRTSSDVVMMNNVFIVTDSVENAHSVDGLPEYEGFHYLSDFSYLSQLTTEYYGPSVDDASVSNFISDMKEGAKSIQGLIFIGNQYHLSYGQNSFYLTKRTIIDADLNASNVYIDTKTDANCMSGNTFYNVDLYINSGDIISCKHTQIRINGKTCVRYFESINDTFHTSYFINSSIVIASSSIIIMDDAVFYNHNNPINILNKASETTSIHLLFLETVFSSTVLTNWHDIDYCHTICHQIIAHNASQLRQLYITCDPNVSNISNSAAIVSLDFWTPYYLVLNPNNIENKTLISPGDSLQIDYKITDRYGNIINQSYYYPNNITMLITNTEIPIISALTIDNNGLCTACESGIDLSSLSVYDVNKSYIISTQIVGNTLITNAIHIMITECDSGSGISLDTLQCEECSEGRYTLTDNLQPCDFCDETLDYIECPGSDIIVAEFNHWINVITEEIHNHSSKILSSDCPNSFCCQLLDGCNYLLNSNDLCALYRDVSSPLCGKCVEGYSELLSTTNCGICERTRYEYFLLLLAIALLFSVYLLYFDVPPKSETTQPKTQNYGTLDVFKDDQRALTVMIFKVLLYFAQGLTFILLASSNVHDGLMFYLLPILQVANLSVQFGINSSDDEAGYCLIEGMTAIEEILLNLSIPLFIAIIITSSWIVNKCCGCKLKCLCFKRRSVSHIAAYLRGLLIVIGSVLGVIFKVLSCRKIDEDLIVHFYYGSHECFDLLWYVSLAGLAVIFIVWCMLDIKLWKLKDKRQKRIVNNLWSMTSAYKPDLWFWESVLLTRRTFLALFTIVNDSSNILNDILTALLCVYFGLQIWKQPFRYKRVNRLESICILMLLFVIIFVNNDVFKIDDATTSLILGLFLLICILLPIIMVLYEILRIFGHLCSCRKLSERDIQKIEMRRPTNNPHIHHEIAMNESGELETQSLKRKQ